jgi:branched-chain amino acid transport system ATP-binding protein
LEATNLRKSFGGFAAVRNASLRIANGESVAIIGPNGAGKSTLFDLLTGRTAADSGQVLLFGTDVTRLPPWRRVKLGLGRSFQVSSVFSSFTALENVQMGILLARSEAWRPYRRAALAFRDEAEALLVQVGLENRLHQMAGELSYGDQRALELAVALSSSPRLLLLDEPTAGMGTAETDECLQRIRAISATHGIPVLFVEHDMSVVFAFATRVIVLVAGEILVEGTPQSVRSDDRVREAYFGESL